MTTTADALRALLACRTRAAYSFEGCRPAAVAVLLHDLETAPSCLLTVRAEGMRKHANQIALPGGVVDPEDASLIAAAQRECEEELGIRPPSAAVLGLLDDLPTRSGYMITPVLVLDDRQRPPTPNPHEIAAIFEVPLALFDETSFEVVGERTVGTVTYPLRAYHHGGHRIWGATAHILEQARRLVEDARRQAGQTVIGST